MKIREKEAELKKQLEEIEDEFDKYSYVMWLASQMKELPEEEHKTENLLKGCQSNVWIKKTVKNGKLSLVADSDTLIVKGVLCLLVSLLNGRNLQEVIDTEIKLFEQLELESVLNDTRKNGIKVMIQEIKQFARENLESNYIVVEDTTSYLAQLAGKELRRYLYLLGEGIIKIVNVIPRKGSCLIAAPRESKLLDTYRHKLQEPKEGGFGIQSFRGSGGNHIVLYGKEDITVLYAVYEFLERQGIRFFLHGDTLPEKKQRDVFNHKIQYIGNPLFTIRGIQPFHDFPEGPDWWNKDNYRQILSQLTKMKGNFIGLHNYPENEKEPEKMTAEPIVWIGMPEDVKEDGTIRAGYPAQHFKTNGGSWGYQATETTEYPFGTGQVFHCNVMEPEYMKGYEEGTYQEALSCSRQEDILKETEKYITLFHACGNFFSEIFGYAKQLQVKTCLGTETPLTVPRLLKRKLGLNESLTDDQITKFYKGIFKRIHKIYPLDYYWLWTPEDWTWKGNTAKDTQNTIQDLLCAQKAIKETDVKLQLALCGWTLGPMEDRAAFHHLLPETVPFSCINRQFGMDPVDDKFRELTGRPAWAIPWLEDDPALVSPQLWVGRVRKDAYDAARYGCEGLIGIHWRTETIAPTIRAMLEAAWKQEEWEQETRTAAAHDFYLDFGKSYFGEAAGGQAGAIFEKADSRVPRPSRWEDGPGNIYTNLQPLEEVLTEYDFVEEFERLDRLIKDADCRERFLDWNNRWKYLAESAKVGCSKAAFDHACEEGNNNKIIESIEHLKKSLIAMERYLMLSIRTMGDIGVLANVQQRTVLPMLENCNKRLKEKGMEPCNWKTAAVDECEKVVLLTERSSLEKTEDFTVRILVIGGGVYTATIHWHEIGKAAEHIKNLKESGGWIYETRITAGELKEDFAFLIEITGKDKILHYPPQGQYPEKTVIIL